jgi:cytoskeletal protein CcmA (bactofilin family)
MFKRLATPIFLVLLLFISASSAFAQNNFSSGDSVTVAKNKVINSDYFSSGKDIKISGTVNGDVYAAGGNVTIDGMINGDVLVAGGDIVINGIVAHDIRTVGGDIIVAAKVGGNVTTLGGKIRVQKNASISGSLTAAGGDVVVAAPIGKSITLASGTSTLSNTVGGNVTGYTSSLIVKPSTKVHGSLTYWSDNEANINSSASISGQTIHHTPPQNQTHTAHEAVSAIAGVFRLMGFVSLLILGLLMVTLMPKFSQKTGQDILNHLTKNVFVGFLALIFTPIVILILFVLILTIPLALVLGTVYLVVLFVGKIFAAYALGIKMAEVFKWKMRTFWIYTIGLIFFYVISSIPILGAFLAFIAVLAGIGAYLNNEKDYYTMLKSKKGI